MPGNVTRLLACDEDQLQRYKGLNLGPTFVHKNHGRIIQRRDNGGEKKPFGARDQDSSPSYNKPGSIMHWVLESEEAKHVDYVLYIDADMLLRLPMDPVKMGVKKGVVVSEHVGYLDTGLKNGIQFEFLPEHMAHIAGDDVNDHSPAGPEGKKHAAGGWYHFFHIDDIRQIAPRWMHYEREMRLNPQKYWRMVDPATGQPGGVDHDIVTGDAYVGHGQAPWISEMYGYVFAAAEAGLRHILTHGVVVYPDEIGAGQPQEPSIIHYGLHCTVGSFHFTKYTHGSFNAVGCTNALFGDPPRPSHLERLCAETVLTLNDAMCAYYERPESDGGCGKPHEVAATCPAWKEPKQRTCADKEASCTTWAAAGECSKNPGFMLGSCPKSCEQCTPQALTRVPSWSRALAIARGEAPREHLHVHPGVVRAAAGMGTLPSQRPASAQIASRVRLVGSNAPVHEERRIERGMAPSVESTSRVAGGSAGARPNASLGASAHASMRTRGLFGPGVDALMRAKGGAAVHSREGATPTQAAGPRGGSAQDAMQQAAAEQRASSLEAPSVVEGEADGVQDGSLATLKWQMYVGWAAILGLCSAVVGRHYCRSSRQRKSGSKASRAV